MHRPPCARLLRSLLISVTSAGTGGRGGQMPGHGLSQVALSAHDMVQAPCSTARWMCTNTSTCLRRTLTPESGIRFQTK